MNLAALDATVRQASDNELKDLLELGLSSFDGLLSPTNWGQQDNPKQQPDVIQFVQLLHLWHLQQMLRESSFEQMLKMFDILFGKSQIDQLHLLDDLKKLLSQLDQSTLHSLHSEVTEISAEQPGTEARRLPELIKVEPQYFHLYEPLRQLLQLPLNDFLSLCNLLLQWESINLLLLTRLQSSGAFDLGDYTTLLVPEKRPPDQTEEVQEQRSTSTQSTQQIQQQQVPPPQPRPVQQNQQQQLQQQQQQQHQQLLPQQLAQAPVLTLHIVEQPPAKCVYKRNVKPAPSVLIEGDQSTNDGNLWLVPVLIRCDTLESEPKLLTGNEPQKITATRTITFKSLKILTTSHKANETLFSFQFELRRYNGNDFEVLHKIVSNPILVLSHSTQLKITPKLLPLVSEVIPFGGPESGGTRVAILGSGFCDSPTVRVKFDQIEVMPVFHGAKTLIVSTPQHEPGTVVVRVCNDLDTWSDQAATYTYHETHPISIPTTTNAFDFSLGPQVMDPPVYPFGYSAENRQAGKFPHVNAMECLDANGFNVLHYTAASGDVLKVQEALKTGAAPFVRDKNGNSPMHWAAKNGHQHIVVLLLALAQTVADIDMRNKDGETAFSLCVRESHNSIAQLLIRSGAQINSQNNLGVSPLHLAALLGNVFLVRLLFSCGATQLTTAMDGYLPIHLACAEGHTEVVKAILELEEGCINSRDYEGDNPLHHAVYSENVNTVKALLESKRPTTAKAETTIMRQQLQQPRQPQQEQVPNTLFAKPVDQLAHSKACQQLKQYLMELEDAATASSSSSSSRFPVSSSPSPSLATKRSPVVSPSPLLHSHIELNARNNDGETPLAIAVSLSSVDIARVLLENKSEVNVTDNCRETPAHISVVNGNAQLISLLLDHGANFYIPNLNGETAYGLSLILNSKMISWMIPSHKRKALAVASPSSQPFKKYRLMTSGLPYTPALAPSLLCGPAVI